MEAGTCVAKVLGAEMTGDPAMLAIGCAEDIEVMPEQRGGEKRKKDHHQNPVFILNAVIAE